MNILILVVALLEQEECDKIQGTSFSQLTLSKKMEIKNLGHATCD
jgi:hypothetical protein